MKRATTTEWRGECRLRFRRASRHGASTPPGLGRITTLCLTTLSGKTLRACKESQRAKRFSTANMSHTVHISKFVNILRLSCGIAVELFHIIIQSQIKIGKGDRQHPCTMTSEPTLIQSQMGARTSFPLFMLSHDRSHSLSRHPEPQTGQVLQYQYCSCGDTYFLYL